HLIERHPDQIKADDGTARDCATGAAFELSEFAAAPLALAGTLVAEDLCLMEATGEVGYRLTAGVLCFPLHWSLAQKLGRPIDLIHEPVPSFEERLATPVDRFFRRLEPARPVWRANWSLVDTTELFLPPAHRGTASAFDSERPGQTLWLRTERQTLRRLPKTRAILFTIRTRVEPLEDVVAEPGVTAALAARVREMPEPLARYKGILPIRDALLAYLDRLSNGDGGSAPSGLPMTG
ncbi:MAG: DUF3445 domain-containing protein, partial [Geminicoccaceae bacterium]|nr:DUF3445 domain-containing protein [Geminicoccaceae bacterium]